MSERESEKLYEQLVESASDVIAVMDNRGVVMFVNRRVGHYPGLTVANMIGFHFGEFVHPEDLAACQQVIDLAFTGSPITDFHFRLVLPDGNILHAIANGGLARINDQDSLLLVCRDATESFDLNQKLIAKNSALGALSEIAVALSGPAALDEKLRAALDRVLLALDLQTGAIVIKDAHGELRLGASTAVNLGELSNKAAVEGRLVCEECMQRGEMMIVPDVRDESVDPLVRQISIEIGIEALVAMPLQCGDTVKAVLSLGVPKPAELDVQTLEFLRLAAGILGPAIQNASLNSDLGDRVNRLAMLERLAKSINAGRDVKTVVEVCMREIADLVSYDLGVVVLLEDGEAEVFPFSRNGVALPTSRIEMGAEQMQHIGTVDGPIAFHHGGPAIPFHTRPETFQPTGGSGAVAPLVCMGRVFGLLKVWCNESDRYGERENDILASAAEHLSIAAHNARLYEAERRKSLELAALTKETQHRIRNNLQVVSSLLSMSLSDGKTGRRAVERCLRQLLAISAVHDLLSPEDMSAKIRLDDCLAKIGTSALHATGRGDSVELSVTGESCLVTVDAATSVGVIVNELVSNAVEHGFEDRDGGRIEIRIRHEDKLCLVEVIDNGTGLPQGFVMPEVPNSASGLGIMASLATYGLGGILEIEGSERGTCARISLKGV